MKINLNNEEVDLNPDILKFNEITLNDYLSKVSAYYAYFNAKWCEAQNITDVLENQFELVYSKKFSEFSEHHTVKAAEALAKVDDSVVEAKKNYLDSKKNKDYLYGFLKAIDKSHSSALNYSYNLRKELTVLQGNTVFHEKKTLDEILN